MNSLSASSEHGYTPTTGLYIISTNSIQYRLLNPSAKLKARCPLMVSNPNHLDLCFLPICLSVCLSISLCLFLCVWQPPTPWAMVHDSVRDPHCNTYTRTSHTPLIITENSIVISLFPLYRCRPIKMMIAGCLVSEYGIVIGWWWGS